MQVVMVAQKTALGLLHWYNLSGEELHDNQDSAILFSNESPYCDVSYKV
jgi:hypothetical protein